MKDKLIEIANRIAQVRLDYDLPEDASAMLASEIDELNSLIEKEPISLHVLREGAKDLVCDDGHSEYNRGVCELIAGVDGSENIDHAQRAKEVAKEIGLVKDIYQYGK